MTLLVELVAEREGEGPLTLHVLRLLDDREEQPGLGATVVPRPPVPQPDAFKGNFDGNVLILISDETSEGGPRFSRLTCDLSKPGRMTSRMEIPQDCKNRRVFMEGTYTRQD